MHINDQYLISNYVIWYYNQPYEKNDFDCRLYQCDDTLTMLKFTMCSKQYRSYHMAKLPCESL